jgi:hypothetical protein
MKRAGRIIVQGGGRRQWWRSADAPTPAARRSCLLGINNGRPQYSDGGGGVVAELDIPTADDTLATSGSTTARLCDGALFEQGRSL